jgi:hypothetical protein
MRSLFRLFFTLLLLIGWGLAAASVHVVRFSERGFGIVPKNRLGIDQTYVDVRTWSVTEPANHPDFVARLTAAGKLHWLSNPAEMPAEVPPAAPKAPAAQSGRPGSANAAR